MEVSRGTINNASSCSKVFLDGPSSTHAEKGARSGRVSAFYHTSAAIEQRRGPSLHRCSQTGVRDRPDSAKAERSVGSRPTRGAGTNTTLPRGLGHESSCNSATEFLAAATLRGCLSPPRGR